MPTKLTREQFKVLFSLVRQTELDDYSLDVAPFIVQALAERLPSGTFERYLRLAYTCYTTNPNATDPLSYAEEDLKVFAEFCHEISWADDAAWESRVDKRNALYLLWLKSSCSTHAGYEAACALLHEHPLYPGYDNLYGISRSEIHQLAKRAELLAA